MTEHKATMSSANGPVPQKKLRDGGARLLALDGGGVKGVSALIILGDIMRRVKDLEVKTAGTSTGGLIALMLFRLRMNTSQCLEEYSEFARQIFAPTIFGKRITEAGFLNTVASKWQWVKALTKGAVYSDGPFKESIDRVVKSYGLDDADKAKKGSACLVHPGAGMMFMCATLAEKGMSVLFRSYNQPEDAKPVTDVALRASEAGEVNCIDISTVARATSAAPFWLPQVTWNPLQKEGEEMIFWDGGMLNNNPVEQLWNARYDLVELHDTAPEVSCVVSLGCSRSTLPKFSQSPISRLLMATTFITNTEAKDMDFKRYAQRMADRNDQNRDLQYFRFDADTEEETFNLVDVAKMDRLEELTRAWIKLTVVDRALQECAELLVSN